MPSIPEAIAIALDHHRAGRLPQAEGIYRQVLAVDADNPDALHLLGVLAHQLGRNDVAVEYITRAIARNGGVAEFHHNLGIVWLALGRANESIASMHQALALDPHRRGAHFGLGRALLLLGRHDAAAAEFTAELALDPENAAALSNLGVCYYELERLDEAKAVFQRAVALQPDHAPAWNNLGAILIEQGDADGAVAAYEAAYLRDPGYSGAYSNRLMGEQYRASVAPEGLKALSLDWDRRFAPSPTPMPARVRQPDTPVRIGFVSPDLYRTPVGYFLVGVAEALAKNEAELIFYPSGGKADDFTARLQAASAQWRDIGPLSDTQAVDLIRADGIDVLFDLAGHTKGNRLPVFAHRAAPVQVSWAGYVGTTGLAAMDYLLADRFHVPEGAEANYRERVLRLPNGYVCYTPPDYAPAVGPLPAATAGRVTFGAFHNAGKVGRASIALWARVMAAIPSSRIILKYRKLDDPQVRAGILREFAEGGIAAERVVIEGTSPHIAMLGRYNDVDIALDSAPYSGGLTTCEALWMGVPVVTLPGRTFAGRHSLSHLSNAGLGEMVAESADHYVAIAAALAGDLERLAALRRSLRPRMAASPLCDAAGFARDFLKVVRSTLAAPER